MSRPDGRASRCRCRLLSMVSAASDGENGGSGFTYGVLVANELSRAAEIRESLRN
jgi:hypothetical protein